MIGKRHATVGVSLVLLSALVMASLTGTFSSQAFAQGGHGGHSQNDDVEFITNAEFIKGHFEQAVANKQAGETELAIAHAGHPIEEVYTLMQGPLEAADAESAAELEEALSALPNSVQSDTFESFTQKVSDINSMLDNAVVAVVGNAANETATRAGVIKGLLETADVEYSEAVENGQIIEVIEYQDASAFINRAGITFELIKDDIDAEESAEIAEFFEQLDSAVSSRAAPSDVKMLLEGIVHELEEAVPDNEHVDFAANLEFIRGHLAEAFANKQAGNTELAVAHASHPVEEVYSLIEGELAEHNAELNEELQGELTNLANQINAMTSQQVQTEVANINTLLDGAQSAVISESERNDPAFNAMVAIALLETADLEYSEAVENGTIIEMIEYQDSTAFITRAEAVFTSSVQAGMPEEEAEEVVEFFEQLDSLTASNASIEEVRTVIGGIIHEFTEVFGLGGEETGYDGQAYIDRIIELLDESVASYKAGNAQAAKAAAIEAYLDNYEFIEADIEEDDAELMEKIEVNMRVELVDMIDASRPATEIESHVNMIKADLETAREFVKSTATSKTKGESWNMINTLLGEAEKLTGKNATATATALEKLEEAKAEYDSVFAQEAEEYAPEMAQIIESSYTNMQEAVESGTVLQFTLNKQYADKLIYKIAFVKIEEELLESEVEEAADWFTVMSTKFKYDQTPSNASRAMADLQKDPSRVEELSPVILEDLRSTFLLKVKEEIVEALEAQGKQPPDNANAQKFAVEGIAYYYTIQPDVQKKLGAEQEQVLFHELEEFSEYAARGDLASMQEEAEEIETMLLSYEGKETTGIGAAISKMIDLLELVTIEYSAAVSGGQIVDREEYDETVLFLSQATDVFNDNKEELTGIAEAETGEVEADLASLRTMVEGMEDPSDVADTVAHAQQELEEILGATGGEVVTKDGWYYIDTIKTLLDDVVAEYNAGNYEEARNLARNEAYLNNYEFIEPDIAEEDPDLMVKIELAIREELVKMIDDRAPAAEIASHVEQIKTDLEVARAVVTPEFPTVIIAVIAAMAVFVLVSRSKGSNLFGSRSTGL